MACTYYALFSPYRETYRGLGEDLLKDEPVGVQDLEGDGENVSARGGGLGNPHDVAVGARVALGGLLAHRHGGGRPRQDAPGLGRLRLGLEQGRRPGSLVDDRAASRERHGQGGRARGQARGGAGHGDGEHDLAARGHGHLLLKGGSQLDRLAECAGAAEVAIRLVVVVRALAGVKQFMGAVALLAQKLSPLLFTQGVVMLMKRVSLCECGEWLMV